MAATTNILFLSAGRRVSLVREFQSALRDLGDPGRTVTADITTSAPAHYVADAHVVVPRCTNADYVPVLLDFCRREAIRLVVPLIDTELPVLAPHGTAFDAVGARLLVSSPQAIAIGRDKRRTAEFFRCHGFDTPHVLSATEVASIGSSDLPVFVKPPQGSASVGATRVDSLERLRFLTAQSPDLMVLELVRGEEYTVDVYADFAGVPRCAVPRRRLATRAGEVSKGLTVRDPAIIAASLEVVRNLPGAIGCITLQLFKTPEGRLRFIEINPRFGGGYPLSWHAGAQFPRWLIEEVNGISPDFAAGQQWRDNLCMLRYDDEIIIDGGRL